MVIIVLAMSITVVACAQNKTETVESTVSVAATEPPLTETGMPLTVFAAASLSAAFDEIGNAFEAANPGTAVAISYAGSNQLATQIREGAPADVFASANQTQMDAAVESSRIDPDAVKIFVTNRLVVIYPASNPAGITSLQDLAKPGTLIVLAAGEVPVGRYSLEFLDLAAADPEFGEAFREAVLGNVVSYEENVRAVLNKVKLGEADAGIVYTSDLYGVEGVDQLEIPDPLNILAQYPIAALNDSPNGEAAARFVSYVLSDAGQSILIDYGFGPAPAP